MILDCASVNWLAVLVASLAAFAVGFVWYGPLFGKKWASLHGFTEESMKESNMVLIFGGAFVATFLICSIMASIMAAQPGPEAINGSWRHGMCWGFTLSILSIGTMIMNAFFERRKWMLVFIDASYTLVYYGLAGAIIGAWK